MSDITRREALGWTAGLLALVAESALPALAQGETDVPFTDIPRNFPPNNPNGTRMVDLRKMDGMLTPKDQFFAINHYNRPEIDPATYKLKLTGMVNKPMQISLADLKAMKSTELLNGYECSGNSGRSMQGLSSCGKFKGVRLSAVLKQAGVQSQAREVVFFGADRGKEDVVFRTNTFKLEQQFGRSISVEQAMKPDPLIAYSLNGDPLNREQGFPVRLIMPGWYGVANVKWLSEIHLQDERYLGNFQARWYRTLRAVGGTGKEDDPETQWVESDVSHIQIKSVIARVRKSGGSHQVLGFVLNDGTPVRTVEVQVDGGPWQKATLDPQNTQYSWKMFSFKWDGATPGEHTINSRATDANGITQPTEAELSRKKTFLEHNAQFPRKVMIA